MTITLNDRQVTTEAATVEELLQEMALSDQPVVAEIDGTVIYREQWSETMLALGMKIELVQFVGGG